MKRWICWRNAAQDIIVIVQCRGDITSVDAKHHGASLSERWNVTWVGNNSVCTH